MHIIPMNPYKLLFERPLHDLYVEEIRKNRFFKSKVVEELNWGIHYSVTSEPWAHNAHLELKMLIWSLFDLYGHLFNGILHVPLVDGNFIEDLKSIDLSTWSTC